MKPFFTPEDFEDKHNPLSYMNALSDKVASIANAKLLSEGKVMFGVMGESRWHFYSSQQIPGKTPQDTHKALLINIEKIEECKHPVQRYEIQKSNVQFFCNNCGVELKLKPDSFEVLE